MTGVWSADGNNNDDDHDDDNYGGEDGSDSGVAMVTRGLIKEG